MKTVALAALVLSFSACHIEYRGAVDVTPLDDEGVEQNPRLADSTPNEEIPVVTEDAGTEPTPTPSDPPPQEDAGDTPVVEDPPTTPDQDTVEEPDAGQEVQDEPQDAGQEEAVDAGSQEPDPTPPPPPPPPQIIIDSDAQLGQLVGMTETPGDLFIRGGTTNLSALKDLKVINGSLLIEYTMDKATHLDNLTTVKGFIEVRSNPNLESIGMPKLTEIIPNTLDGSAYRFADNPKLSQCAIDEFFSKWKGVDTRTGNGPCR